MARGGFTVSRRQRSSQISTGVYGPHTPLTVLLEAARPSTFPEYWRLCDSQGERYIYRTFSIVAE